MNIMGKVLSVFMVIVLLLTVAPLSGLADIDWLGFEASAEETEFTEGDYTYTVTDNEATITTYNGSGGDVVVPDTLDGYSVTGIGTSAFSYCRDVISIKIPNSVTSIGNDAFFHCYDLESIEIPDGVTSIGSYAFYNTAYYNENSNWEENVLYIGNHLIVASSSIEDDYVVKDGTITIADYAFNECGLKSIEIPASVRNIGNRALCTGYNGYDGIEYGTLTNITVDENSQYYSSEDGVLFNKEKTELVVYPESNERTSYVIPSTVTSIGKNAFRFCSNLLNLIIPESVSNIEEGAFDPCILENITVDENNEYYLSEDGVLFNKDKTELVVYPGGSERSSYVVPEGVRRISNSAFSLCYNLVSIYIPEGVTTIGDYAFNYCSLYSMEIPDSVVSIGANAFHECLFLTNIVIGNGVESIGEGAFFNCTDIDNVYITDIANWCEIDFEDKDSNPLYNNADLYLNDEIVTELMVPEGTKCINNYAFTEYSPLTRISIPDSVTRIGNYTFEECNNLMIVEGGSGLTSIGDYAFSYCENLQSITIPDSVTNIGDYAFYVCTNLISVDSSEDISSRRYGSFKGTNNPEEAKIGEYAFAWCTSLASITIPYSITSIEEYAFYVANISSVTIGDNVRYIGNNAFDWCVNLTDIGIGNGVTNIGEDAFCNTAYYNSESNWENEVIYIGDYLIKANEAISGKYVIRDGTSAIADYAFLRCRSLTSVEIPKSMENIGDGAFYYCSNLTDVYYNGSRDEWNNIAIGRDNRRLINSTIYCSDVGTVTDGDVTEPITEPTITPTTQPTATPTTKPVQSTTKPTTTKPTTTKPTTQPTTTKPITTKPVVTKPTTTEKDKTESETVKVKKPAKVKIKSAKSSKKNKAVIIWAVVKNVNGYEVQYSTSKKFAKKTTKKVIIKKAKTKKTTLKKLKSGKKYFIRVRAYKTVNGKKVYGAWSKVKTVKVKRNAFF